MRNYNPGTEVLAVGESSKYLMTVNPVVIVHTDKYSFIHKSIQLLIVVINT